MTIYFITGGLGFMGQYIVKAIHDHDPEAELRILRRTARPTFLRVEDLDRTEWISGDLAEAQNLDRHLKSVDTVIHNAAMVSFRRSDDDAVYRANVLGTRHLLHAAQAADVRQFIFISSIAAVGVEEGRASDERMVPELEPLRRSSMYGYTKVVSELELQEAAGRLRVIILNPSLVLGPGSDRINLVARAAQLLPVLPMPSYVHSFVDVRDFARAVVLSLTNGRSGERYIVTSHHEDMLRFTRMVLKALNKRLWLVPVSGRWVVALEALLWLLDQVGLNPGIRNVSSTNIDHRFSNEKIRTEMSWEPAFALEQSIRDSVAGRGN